MVIKDELMNPYFVSFDAKLGAYNVMEDTGKWDKNFNAITKAQGYYSNLDHALRKIIEMKSGDNLAQEHGDQVTLAQYLEELRKVTKQINSLIPKFELDANIQD